jgi:DNA-binding NarL/FixJ family response regulator
MIRVAIIEEHQVLIDALEFVIRLDETFDFVGGAITYEQGLMLVQSHTPDVVLVDVGLVNGGGVNFIAQARQYSPKTQFVVFSGLVDRETILRSVELGVFGFVHKSCKLPELMATLRKAAQGELVMSSGLIVNLLKRIPRPRNYPITDIQLWENLTPRECQILSHLAAGKSSNEIAIELNIAPLTVRTHVRNLMSKLGVHSRLEAVAFGIRHGLIAIS